MPGRRDLACYVTLCSSGLLFNLFCCYCSVTKSCLTLCDPTDRIMPCFPVLRSLLDLLKLVSVDLVMPSNNLILCRPFLFLLSFFPGIKVFSSELSLCIHWPEYWSSSFRISPSNEYSGLIFFRIDWFDLLAVQGTLKSSPSPQFEGISSSFCV